MTTSGDLDHDSSLIQIISHIINNRTMTDDDNFDVFLMDELAYNDFIEGLNDIDISKDQSELVYEGQIYGHDPLKENEEFTA